MSCSSQKKKKRGGVGEPKLQFYQNLCIQSYLMHFPFCTHLVETGFSLISYPPPTEVSTVFDSHGSRI